MSAGSPVVSVIVPTLNRPRELGQALASITGQDDVELTEIEVIVVNDGGAPVEGVLTSARARGLVATLVNHPRRLGLPTARNTGIAHAHGEYLAFLDDDDVFLPPHLATALAGLESRPPSGQAGGVDAVVTACLVSDHRVDPSGAGGDPGATVVAWDVGFDALLLEACNLFPVHTVVLRHPATAWFDPALPAVEDWDFWLRLTREHGYRFTRLPQATVIYHRLPQAPSMIGAISQDAAAMAGFSALVRTIWSRYPASTPRSARFRLYSGIMHWQVLGQLATGAQVHPHYYLRSVQALEHAWREPAAETDLIERLMLTVTGDHHNDPADDQRVA